MNENKCDNCLWYSENHISSKIEVCRLQDKHMDKDSKCDEFRHINTVG